LNCVTCASWQPPHVSGVGIFAFAKSSFVVWSAPWQATQSTSILECFDAFQSFTMLGFTRVWQSTQPWPAPGFAAGGALFFCAAAGAASATSDRTRASRVWHVM
jgi:hypothetical protein